MGVMAKYVTSDGVTHLITNTFYGTCDTASGTVAKIVKLVDSSISTATLISGMLLSVKFTNTNTVASPTLTIQNSTGATTLIAAKSIMRGNLSPSISTNTSWSSGAVVNFVYDGTNWQMVDWTEKFDSVLFGTGTAAQDKGSGVTNRYVPAKWTFNTGLSAVDGDIITIKIPVAGHDYGVYLSIDNGTNYYPIVCNGTGRLSTHYPVSNYITLVYEPTGSAASMFPLNGGDSRVTVSGGVWRVINYYDSNSNDTGYYLRRIYPNLKAGVGGIFPYTIIMQQSDGRWSSLVTSSSTGTSKSRNTNGFRAGSNALLMYANATYAADSNVGTYNIWSMHSGLIDHRYSFNTANNSTNGTTGYKPIYLVGTINSSDGLFYLDATWWTQTLPTDGNGTQGKVYIYIGDAYDYYRMTFVDTQRWYIYSNGKIRDYFDGNGLTSSMVTTALGYTPYNSTNPNGYITSNHAHGNITSAGLIASSANVDIANNDRLVIVDSSDNSKVKLSDITFDGSTTSKVLNQKGDWLSLGTASTYGVTTSVTSGSTNLVTSGAVYSAIDALPSPMVFRGSLGTGGVITALPVDGSAKVGDTYKVITAGTYYGDQSAKIGDMYICDSKTARANTWVYIPSADEPSGTVTSVGIANGGGLSVSGSPVTTSGVMTVTHSNSGVASGTYGTIATTALTPGFGDTFTVPAFTVNAMGHITTAGAHNVTMPSLGTTSTTAAKGDHTHTTSIATSSGTNQLTLNANTKYSITAGGTSYVFTTPTDSNTHRPIQLEGTEILGNNTTALNLKSGTLMTITNSSGTVTFTHKNSGVTSGTYGTVATTALEPGYGGTFNVPAFTVDAQGHITTAGSHTVKIPASDNTDTKVSQTVTTTSANYEVLFSETADNTTRTEGARKNDNLLFNPNTNSLTIGNTGAHLTYNANTQSLDFSFG